MEKNKDTYSSEKVVQYYNKYESLQRPEQSILTLLKDELSKMDMLDIGIGGGRTTKHFAPLVKSYTGIDYSEAMVNVCRTKFKTTFPPAEFLTVDVRDLSSLKEKKFDLILFSFNGFDALEHSDRIHVLKEIKNRLKVNGYFCFSTHNIRCVKKWASIEFSFRPTALLANILLYFKRKKMNKFDNAKIKEVQRSDHMMLNDGGHDWLLDTFYIQPSVQLKELKDQGYTSIKIFSLDTGKELSQQEAIVSYDKWLYFLCR